MTTMMSGHAAVRRPGLDVIRAAAILLVMLHHFRHLPGCPEWLRWVAVRSFVGVDLFFVLSGWLIGGQLFRELRATGGIDVVRFWAKRWLRTLPSYYVVLATLVVAGSIAASDVAAMATFTQNYVNPQGWLVSWSLCIEEQFYLVLPVLVLAVRRARPPFAAAALVTACLVSPALRWTAHHSMAEGSYGDFIKGFYGVTHLRLEGLAIGVSIAGFRVFRPNVWARLADRAIALAVFGTAAIVAGTWNPWWTGFGSDGVDRMAFFPAVPGFVVVSVGVALLLPLAETARVRSVALGAGTLFVAEHAYALYLTHDQILRFTGGVSQRYGFWPALVVTFVLAFAVAVGLRRLVERPVLVVRDRWLARRPDGAESSHVRTVPPRRGTISSGPGEGA